MLLTVLRRTFGPLLDPGQLIEVSNFLELLFSQYEHLSNQSWCPNNVSSLYSSNHGLYRCHRAGIARVSTFPSEESFGLQTNEAEIIAALAVHVLTSFRVLNQRAAKHTCSDGGATLDFPYFFPGGITQSLETLVFTGTVSVP